MNHEREDAVWCKLLAQSRPAFSGETEPPYGFVTATTARLVAERRQREIVEKIGFRAVMASLAALGLATALTLMLELRDTSGGDPEIQNLANVENMPLS